LKIAIHDPFFGQNEGCPYRLILSPLSSDYEKALHILHDHVPLQLLDGAEETMREIIEQHEAEKKANLI